MNLSVGYVEMYVQLLLHLCDQVKFQYFLLHKVKKYSWQIIIASRSIVLIKCELNSINQIFFFFFVKFKIMAFQPNSGMFEIQKLVGASNYIAQQFRIKNNLQKDYLWESVEIDAIIFVRLIQKVVLLFKLIKQQHLTHLGKKNGLSNHQLNYR